jgi:hypothetical protein
MITEFERVLHVPRGTSPDLLTMLDQLEFTQLDSKEASGNHYYRFVQRESQVPPTRELDDTWIKALNEIPCSSVRRIPHKTVAELIVIRDEQCLNA